MKEKIRRREILLSTALISMFITASGLIKAPFSAYDYGNPLAILIAGLILAFILILMNKPIKSIWSFKGNGVLIKGLYILIAALLVLAAFFTAKEHTKFIYDIVLPRTSRFLIAAVFLACVFVFSLSESKALLKFSLISAFAVSLIFVVLFLLSVKNFSFKNVFYGVNTDAKLLIKDTLNYFLTMFLPALISLMFLSERGEVSAGSLLSGVSFGLFLISVCVLDSILSFGSVFATRLKYPYIDDISTVTVGSLFTRMDGFSYFAFFAAYLIKGAVCVRLAISILRRAGFKYGKMATAVFCVVSAFFI